MHVILSVDASPYLDQTLGTSGLRKPTGHAMQPHYVALFMQAVFAELDVAGATLVVGGDGRFFNDEAIQTILKMAVAHKVGHVVVGRGGLLSTPAASALIRARRAKAGIILSASHNPGGPDGDFGIKINAAHGGPIPIAVSDAIHRRTRTTAHYEIADMPDIALDRDGRHQTDGCLIEVIDGVADYVALLETLFDFERIADLFRSGFTMRFDAMHAVTGPYASELFQRRLGLPAASLMNQIPMPDFGGLHPDPNPHHAADLVDFVAGRAQADFGAASDGDGDRNLIVGRGLVVSPSDSLAVIAANAHLVPGYRGGLAGVARSMPTSRALDRVAASLGVPCHVTPTGWKFFASLLEAGLITICGEESAGTGSNHVREKDGLWAVMMWLNILAERRQPVSEILRDHWQAHGRDYYQRLDFEEVDAAAAEDLMETLRRRMPRLAGELAGRLTVTDVNDFAYDDPVDGSTATKQGVQIIADEARIVYRLSGTGTRGATLRVYLERFAPRGADHQRRPAEALAEVQAIAMQVADITRFTGRTSPSVIS
jgi:phosphoglucomutase